MATNKTKTKVKSDGQECPSHINRPPLGAAPCLAGFARRAMPAAPLAFAPPPGRARLQSRHKRPIPEPCHSENRFLGEESVFDRDAPAAPSVFSRPLRKESLP